MPKKENPKTTILFEIEKPTPSTFRYRAVATGMPPPILYIYIERWFAKDPPPDYYEITLEPKNIKSDTEDA